jgi:hypothetical protein
MKKVISYQLKDVIRKENEQYNEKPDDIGTKPIPRWLKNNEEKSRHLIKQLFIKDTR